MENFGKFGKTKLMSFANVLPAKFQIVSYGNLFHYVIHQCTHVLSLPNLLLYSRELLRTINLAVFTDFTVALKINSLKSYCSIL